MPRLARFVDPGSAGRTLTGICPGLPSEAFKNKSPCCLFSRQKRKRNKGISIVTYFFIRFIPANPAHFTTDEELFRPTSGIFRSLISP